MKIFVLHYSKLTERKIHILEQFTKHNITDYEFIELYDKDSITDEESKQFTSSYKKPIMSLFLKHIYAYKQIIEKYDNALIFEDDVKLCENFMYILKFYINQLPENYDMLFISDGCNLHIEHNAIISNKYIYKKCLYPTNWGGDGATRCTDAYIINKKCALTLCEYINKLNDKIYLPVDWWLNVAARDNNLNVFWAEPTIVTQGSITGQFKSTLN